MVSVPSIILLLVGIIGHAPGLEIPFSDKPSPGFSGLWPTVPVLYGPGHDRIDCYMTLWNTSVFVLESQCPLDVHSICPVRSKSSESTSQQRTDAGRKVNMTQMMCDDRDSYTPEDGNILSVLHVNGESRMDKTKIELAGSTWAPRHMLGDNLTVWPSHLAKVMPLSDSLLSLKGVAKRLVAEGSVQSNLVGMHLGSSEPKVTPSLHVGGYDEGRIMGNILKFDNEDSYDSYDVAIFGVRIGVEQGFLPLRSLLPNGSYPIGPYQSDRRIPIDGRGSIAGNVKFEPGTPYLHLPNSICAPLADALGLTYEVERNVYLWNYEASHPLFHCPAYLEFKLGSGSNIGYAMRQGDTTDLNYQPISFATVKIPFALLRPTFQAAVDPVSGAQYPPRAYFPCSPVDRGRLDPKDYSWLGKTERATLGRAFLQSAFVGIQYHDGEEQPGTYWVAQAPGPTNLIRNVIDANDSGIPARNRTLQPNAWTESWSGPLPIWTVDADGETTLAERLGKPPTLDRDDKIAIGVGVPLGVIAVALLVYFTWTRCLKSRREWKKIREDIAKEDDIARKRELIMRQRQRTKALASAQTTASQTPAEVRAVVGDVTVAQRADMPETSALLTDSDAISSSTEMHKTGPANMSHKIPRKPVQSQQ